MTDMIDATNPNERTKGSYFPDNYKPLADHRVLQLVDDLRWHTAAAASFLANMEAFEKKTAKLKQQIDSLE